MEKKNVVFLTVLAIATLLTAVVGTTFAYFTASLTNDNGNQTPVNVTTQTMPNITVEAAGTGTEGTILPGWVGYEYVEVTATAGSTGAVAHYNLTATHTLTNATHLAGMITVHACEVGSSVSLPSALSYAAGSAVEAVRTGEVADTGKTSFYISGASATMPTCTTTIVNNTALSSNATIALAANKTIAQGETQKFVIIYDFDSTNASSANHDTAQGENFSVAISSELANAAVATRGEQSGN